MFVSEYRLFRCRCADKCQMFLWFLACDNSSRLSRAGFAACRACQLRDPVQIPRAPPMHHVQRHPRLPRRPMVAARATRRLPMGPRRCGEGGGGGGRRHAMFNLLRSCSETHNAHAHRHKDILLTTSFQFSRASFYFLSTVSTCRVLV